MAAAAKGSLTPTRVYLVRHGQVAVGRGEELEGHHRRMARQRLPDGLDPGR